MPASKVPAHLQLHIASPFHRTVSPKQQREWGLNVNTKTTGVILIKLFNILTPSQLPPYHTHKEGRAELITTSRGPSEAATWKSWQWSVTSSSDFSLHICSAKSHRQHAKALQSSCGAWRFFCMYPQQPTHIESVCLKCISGQFVRQERKGGFRFASVTAVQWWAGSGLCLHDAMSYLKGTAGRYQRSKTQCIKTFFSFFKIYVSMVTEPSTNKCVLFSYK